MMPFASAGFKTGLSKEQSTHRGQLPEPAAGPEPAHDNLAVIYPGKWWWRRWL